MRKKLLSSAATTAAHTWFRRFDGWMYPWRGSNGHMVLGKNGHTPERHFVILTFASDVDATTFSDWKVGGHVIRGTKRSLAASPLW